MPEKTFAELLKEKREHVGIGVKKLATEIKCPQSYVNKAEKGESVDDKPGFVDALADYFEIEGDKRDEFYWAAGVFPPEIKKYVAENFEAYRFLLLCAQNGVKPGQLDRLCGVIESRNKK